jgi:dienelactone hydrolase
MGRYPSAVDSAPYLVVPSLPGPTPQFYSAEEAMTFLKPSVITPDKYGAILIGTRSANFFGDFNRSIKRKLLEPVERGMKLVILQQDFNKNKLDWLPIPLKFEGAQESTFDPAGALGLQKVTVPGIMWQRIAKTEGWDVFGNGGIARYKLGRGEIWVTSARLMQNMHIKDAAIDFVKLLSVGGKQKPTVLVDSGSEGGEFTSSNHPDLMNSHDIPFMTLGEVIAQEQKMDSFTPIAGPVSNDDVLNGNGPSIASKFVRDQVIQMAKQPTAPNVPSFEKLRTERKKELMRSLGLDPMPEKTPLNARITGTIQRNGYRIEKVVFESRPQFFVTCHVYVPDSHIGRMPIIVNVNGHWAHKKDEDRIQLRSAFQATQGYIAIAVDSPGWSFEGNSLIERRDEGNHNDFKLIQGGSNTTGYYVWDTMRALDYMSTRSDADMSRIGITGASGGGLGTLYTFAADDRYKAAVPVVYMASMETAPDNGCLCNHVPATSQIGDRSDVIGIQAPKPVYIMGAQNDGEFPPAATRLTHQKMQETWALFGKKDDVQVQIFAGGHDYNQLMREASIGFFNKYVKGMGDGSPVKQPALQAIDPADRQLLVLDPPLKERTMRDLSKEYLAKAKKDVSVAEVIEVNGGVPANGDLKVKEVGSDWPRTITFESEPGLVTPGILMQGTSTANEVTIYVSDDGKAAEFERHNKSGHFGTELFLDVLGTGELSEFDLRFPIYAGRSVAFTAGIQIARAADLMKKFKGHIKIVGRGPMSSQAVMYAALINPAIASTTGIDCLQTWSDIFKDAVPDMAVQPRAHLCGTLENLRKKVKNGEWKF